MAAQITIVLDDDGHVSVTAPLENKVLCYGLLEIARDVVMKHQPPLVRPVQGTLTPPPGMPQ